MNADNKKIKIIHFVCGLKSGGVEEMIINYAKGLDKERYDFYIAYQHEVDSNCLNKFEELNFKCVNIPSKAKHPIGNFKETYKVIKKNNFDIVHTHMTLMNFIPLICGKMCGVKKLISHSHNYDNRKKGILKRVFERICKFLVEISSNINIACGEQAGKFLYGKRDFIIIKNAVNLEKFKFNIDISNKIKSELKLSDKIILGHIGRFTKQKNHIFLLKILIKLLEKNSKFHLLLIGEGELMDETKQYAIDHGILNNVTFLGTVKNTGDYYKIMDIFILPSLWEGFPVVGVESQIAGLKCIMSENIDKTIKITEKTEFLNINSVDDWVDKISSIEFNYQKDISLDEFNKSGYNIETEVKVLDEIYMRKKEII